MGRPKQIAFRPQRESSSPSWPDARRRRGSPPSIWKEAAANLDKLVEEARRKKQEAKKPYIRVRDAETKLDAAKRAKEAATADVEAKQTALAKAVQTLAEAETKVATAQSELQEIRSTAYSESPAAYEGLEQLRAVEMPPEARAALAAVAAGLPAKPPPPPPVGPALEAVAAAAKEEDMPMPSFDELPTERVNGPQVGRRRRSTSPGQRNMGFHAANDARPSYRSRPLMVQHGARRESTLVCLQEHRLGPEVLPAATGGQAKDGWPMAAAHASSTQTPGKAQDGRHWSGGVTVAVPMCIGVAYPGCHTSFIPDFPGHEGRFTAIWAQSTCGFSLLVDRRGLVISKFGSHVADSWLLAHCGHTLDPRRRLPDGADRADEWAAGAAHAGGAGSTEEGTCRQGTSRNTIDYFLVHRSLAFVAAQAGQLVQADAPVIWQRVAKTPSPLPLQMPIGCAPRPPEWPAIIYYTTLSGPGGDHRLLWGNIVKCIETEVLAYHDEQRHPSDPRVGRSPVVSGCRSR